MRAAKVLELERRLQEPAFLAGAAWGAEEVAKMIETGQFCRLADHVQKTCDCPETAATIRNRFGLTSEETK